MTIDGAAYTLDNPGNRTAKTDERTGVTSNYTYDAIYELTKVTQGTNTTESYTFDPVGNRLSSLGVSPYNYNTSNEIISTPSTTYTYDNNGNTLTSTTGSNTTSYIWDFENRLSSVTLPGSGGTVSFKYDPFGRRIEKATSSTTSIYAYDGDNLIEEASSTGTAAARYAMGLYIDEPLAILQGATTDYYQIDGLGSITSLSNSSGANAETYTYDSFGNLTASTGSLTNRYRYTGREFDSETSLYYYRARYYDPATGRFVSEDPIGFIGGINFYTYVVNNPVIFVDANGLWHNTGRPSNPKDNTIVCNGKGGIRVQLGDTGTADQTKCLGPCIAAHEASHKRDALAANPTVCQGAASGIQVAMEPQEQSPSEIAAANAEINCLKKQRPTACDSCQQKIDQRIKQERGYRDGFKKPN